jgi:hypothetical protein
MTEPRTINYDDIPTGRLGPNHCGGTAALIITPSAENGGTIGLHIFEDVGGNSWPMRVHHGRAIMVGDLAGKSGESVEEILREHEDLIRAIDAAFQGTRWDGNNHVGVWDPVDEDETADEAPTEQLREALEEAASYWEAQAWLDGDFATVVKDLYAALAEGKSVEEYAADEAAAAKGADALIDRCDVERILQRAVDEGAAGRYGVDLPAVCSSRFAVLLAAGKTIDEAAACTREALPSDRRGQGVVCEGRFVLRCECGAVDGEQHDYDLDGSEDVAVLEWMPLQHRASHEAAGNCGVYPHNGAVRVVVLRDCAERVVAEEGDDRWARIVEESPHTHRPLDLSSGCTGDEPGATWWECESCHDYAWLAPGQEPPACSCDGSED